MSNLRTGLRTWIKKQRKVLTQRASGTGNIQVAGNLYVQLSPSTLSVAGLVECPACAVAVSPEAFYCLTCGHPVRETLRLARVSREIATLDKVGLMSMAVALISLWMTEIVPREINYYCLIPAAFFGFAGWSCKQRVEELKRPNTRS